MMYPGCLALIVVVLLLFLLPFFFAQVMLIALTKLGLNPYAAFFIIMGILAGSVINIPVKRFYRDEEILDDSLRMFGFSRLFALPRLVRHHVTVAVNVGGCVIPSLLAVYECLLVARRGPVPRRSRRGNSRRSCRRARCLCLFQQRCSGIRYPERDRPQTLRHCMKVF